MYLLGVPPRGSGYLAEDDDLFLKVPVDGLGVVEEVPQDLGVRAYSSKALSQ